MKKVEMVFIPAPVMGHIAQAIELAKHITGRDERISVTVLLAKLPVDPIGTKFIDSLRISSESSIRFVHLPAVTPGADWVFETAGTFMHLIIQHQKPHVREIISGMERVAGVVVDMLCTAMIDVADELGLPSYVFFTSPAAFLGMMLHFQALHDDHNQDIPKFRNSGADLAVPSYSVPVPPSVLPVVLTDKKQWNGRFLHYARGYRKAKAVIVNTFLELEPHALDYLSSSLQVFPVGPILKQAGIDYGQNHRQSAEIRQWLDTQPPRSVVFLCFGSRGAFEEEQVSEIAKGLEQSGQRFLWSLRRPPPKGTVEFPAAYDEEELKVLPEGFLDRTAATGKVVVDEWVEQVDVLRHAAVGGFVCHCGWNSVLESLCCGVPIATWPMYAEQQINAFQLVRELGLAVEISLDYDQYVRDGVVKAAQIEKGIRRRRWRRRRRRWRRWRRSAGRR